MTRAFCLAGALRARAGFGEYMVQYNLVVEGAKGADCYYRLDPYFRV